MVHHGKNHKQAMGAVMSHLGARVLSVLKENRPYELRDTEGKVLRQDEAKRLILAKYQVPEEIRRVRRRRRSRAIGNANQRRNDWEMPAHRTKSNREQLIGQ